MRELRRWIWIFLGYDGILPITQDDLRASMNDWYKKIEENQRLQLHDLRGQIFEHGAQSEKAHREAQDRQNRLGLAASVLGDVGLDVDRALELADKMIEAGNR